MPIFWTEERISKSGARLPYTEVHVAGLTLGFRGRFGPKLKAAAQRLEQEGGGKGNGAAAQTAGTEDS